MYGATTIGQIFEGKQLKRGMEAKMIIYLLLYKVYVDNVLERYSYLHQEISNQANHLSTGINSMDLDSANNHLNKINAEAKVILKIFSTLN